MSKQVSTTMGDIADTQIEMRAQVDGLQGLSKG